MGDHERASTLSAEAAALTMEPLPDLPLPEPK
jgi:hypothetical protein